MDIKQGIYQHYKGNLYQVLGLCRHSETLEIMVVYQALYDSYGIWVRPYQLFIGLMHHEGKEVKRFQFIQENLTIAPSLR